MIERQQGKEFFEQRQNKILFLTTEASFIQRQIAEGPVEVNDYSLLADGVSTDAIFETKHAFTTNPLGQVALTGFPEIKEGTVQNNNFNIIVAGENFGRGSAREQAPLTLKLAEVELIIAKSFDPRFQRNCANIGILCSSNLDLIPLLQKGEPIPKKRILAQLPSLQAKIIKYGGLIPYSLARQEGKISIPPLPNISRPLTMIEKITALNLEKKATREKVYPQPGDSVVIEPDILASYELFTQWIFRLAEKFNLDFTEENLGKLRLFSDHVVQSKNPRAAQLLETHLKLAEQYGVKYHSFQLRDGGENISSGVCHTLLRELEISSPGEILLMTDSHTPTAAAMLSLGLPTSITGMTTALATGEYIMEIPQTVRVQLKGKLSPAVTSKDVILYLINQYHSYFKGQCIEFGGQGIEDWWPEEIGVLTNMAVEGMAFTALVEPNQRTIEYLAKLTNKNPKEIEDQARAIKPDSNASYAQVLIINLNNISPMVAKPGSPMNAVPLDQLSKRPKIDIVYIGSCTGGTWLDIVQTAKVLKEKQVAPGVKLYIQPTSIAIYQDMWEAGLDKIFISAGAIILPPACGACCGLGLGGPQKGEVSVSTSNRNFPGRMGEGDTWLTSTPVAAATAIAGRLCHPNEL